MGCAFGFVAGCACGANPPYRVRRIRGEAAIRLMRKTIGESQLWAGPSGLAFFCVRGGVCEARNRKA